MKKSDKLDILYEDKFIIIINKPTGLLTVATDKEHYNTLYRKVSEYVKKQHKSNKIFIVNRLDRDTSGIVVLAKSKEIKEKMQINWNKNKRHYVAVVEGNIKNSGIIDNYLKETKTLKTYITNDKNNGKHAITKYTPIINNKRFSLIDIEIFSGRKNQIRIHLSSINHPIVGDKKYGSNKNPIRRMCLHATSLELIHPITNKILIINSNYPKIFEQIVTNM